MFHHYLTWPAVQLRSPQWGVGDYTASIPAALLHHLTHGVNAMLDHAQRRLYAIWCLSLGENEDTVIFSLLSSTCHWFLLETGWSGPVWTEAAVIVES